MLKKLLLPGLVLLLQGCMTFDYVPEEYVLPDGKILQFPVIGTVQTNNLQPSDDKVIFFSSSSDWQGSYKRVTEHLRWQLDKEIRKNGIQKSGTGQKTIGVKVSNLAITQRAFHFTSVLDFTVSLGNGEVLEKHVMDNSPGNIWRALNGALAVGVVVILRDENVRKYLAQ